MSRIYIFLFLVFLPPIIISQHCIDDVQQVEKSGLVWPFPTFVPPWVLYPDSRVYQSICLDNFLANMFQSPLNELTNITIQEILDTYTENKCPFYLHGGLLRDVLSGDPSHDIDISFSCDTETAFQICKNILGESEIEHNISMCYVNSVGYIFIGRRFIDTGIEGKYWELSMFHVENQEYTPNMLYYDLINRFIVDLSTGVEDIQKHQIRIPVRQPLWDLWFYTSNRSLGSESMPVYYKWLILKKITRYWKLRAKGYADYNLETKNYLRDKVSYYWDSKQYPMQYAFKMFLCETFSGRMNQWNMHCITPTAYRDIPEATILFCQKYMHEIYLDFYDIQEGRIVEEINEMVYGTKCFNYHLMVKREQKFGGSFGERVDTLNILFFAFLGLFLLFWI